MKCIYIAALLCFLTSLLEAQGVPNIKFGKVNEKDFQQNYYINDSSAEAVVLYESGDVDYGYGYGLFKMIYTYHVRYKILKKSGTDRAVIKIPLINVSHAQTEMLNNLEGYTYNLENGKVVTTKLNKESIFHEQAVDNIYQEKITMPNVKEGSIFELKYVLETPFTVRVNPNTWNFQRDIPVLWSKYTLLAPEEITYRHQTGGYLKFYIKKEEAAATNQARGIRTRARFYQFVMKDVPAFHNEKFITSEKDYISKVDFELIQSSIQGDFIRNYSNTWDDVVKMVLKEVNLGEALHQKRFLKNVVLEMNSIKDSMQKINTAFEYISKNIKWDKSETMIPQNDLSKVFENKKGNSAEINIILVNLLNELGFDASPVILSTRGNGMINELFPMAHQFNFLIAHVNYNGKDLLMDATAPLSRPGMLPERCLNGTGRLMHETKSRFISLDPVQKRAGLEMLNVTIDPKTGLVSGTASISDNGYSAYENRVLLNEKGEENYIKETKQLHAEWHFSNFKIENADKPAEVLKMFYEFESPDNAAAETIYLNPMFLSKVEDNPFKETNRIYPVDLELRSDHAFIANIKIPKGYTVEEIPESANVMLPDNLGKFTYLVTKTADAIAVSSRIVLNEYYFAPEEYSMLQDFYDEIIKRHAAQIVLKKKI